MASLIDTLIDVLGQEDAEYKKLLELSNNKTKAIVGADIERLQDILVQEQARIDAINKLEQQRMENVDDICNVLNLRRTDIKLEDILENKINRNAIGVKNLDVFKSKYEKLGATGVIYFPEIDKYEFLEAGDIVIPWVSHENVEKSLEEALKPYRKLATDKVVKQRVAAKKAYVESLDPEDALVELSGLSLQRHVSSR